MIKNVLNIFVIIVILLVGIANTQAQEIEKQEEITVEAAYQPKVSDAFKVNVSPRIPEEPLQKPTFKYSILDKIIETPATVEPIKAARIRGESMEELYKNYAKVGFGNYATPLFEFYASSLRNKKGSVGVSFNHRSSAGKIKNYAYPGNSITQAAIDGRVFMKNHTFETNAFYRRTGVHYYGYKPDEFPSIDLSKKDIRQRFNHIGLDASFGSNYRSDSKLNHRFDLGYYLLTDRIESSEHGLSFQTAIDKKTSFLSFADSEALGLDAGVNYYLNSDSLNDLNSGLVLIKPFYRVAFDQYNFELGLNNSIEIDSGSTYHFYPDIKVEVTVVEGYLTTFAGINGSLEQNTLLSLSSENPFINTYLEKKFTNVKARQFGGLKGKIGNFLDYVVFFENTSASHMPFFVLDYDNPMDGGIVNRFTVVYDKVKLTTIKGDFGIKAGDHYRGGLEVVYNNYFMDEQEQPWHKPALVVSVKSSYSLKEKILVKGEIFYHAKMYGREFVVGDNGVNWFEAVELDPRTDLNLGFEYRYSKVLSGWLDLNNLLGQRYYRWHNYPSYRFNMMLGVSYRF